MGNRDMNKVRLTAELAELAVPGTETPDDGPFWDSKFEPRRTARACLFAQPNIGWRGWSFSHGGTGYPE